MNSVKDRLGVIVREKRNARHITQEELAEKVNVTTGMIGQIERGETMPSVETLASIIDKLDIDPKALFCGTNPSDVEYGELCSVISRMSPAQRRTLLKFARIVKEDFPK